MIEAAHVDTMQIDTYLAALRTHLGPMTLSERDEIVREISAHIRDSAEESGVSVETILARLGSAEELAAQYSDGLLIRRLAAAFRVKLMRGALRLATKGISGILVFFVGMFGYLIGGGCVLSGLLKGVFPAHTGTWFQDGRMIASGTQWSVHRRRRTNSGHVVHPDHAYGGKPDVAGDHVRHSHFAAHLATLAGEVVARRIRTGA